MKNTEPVKKPKRAVVTFASLKNNYIHGLARLAESLRNNFDGDLIAFTNEETLGCEKHSENPYTFKVYALNKALNSGYETVLWVDCSVFAVGNIDHLFDEIEENGLMFQDAGHFLGTWASDASLDFLDISRDEAMEVRMIGNAGFLGISFNHILGGAFFNSWHFSASKGLFKGAWNNDKKTESEDGRCKGHRHDMALSSGILHNMGLLHLAKQHDEILQYGAGPYDKILNETIVLKAQGL